MHFKRHLAFTLAGLILCIGWFAFTQTDLRLQGLFFDIPHQQWMWNRDDPIKQLLLYDGPKYILVGFAVCLALAVLFGRYLAAVRDYRHGIRVVFLSLLLVPAFVGALKAGTNVPCPRDLAYFGGDLPYTGLAPQDATGEPGLATYRCFPAGHASGGFALLSLFFLFKSDRNRKRAVVGALTVGTLMGGYKMLIGDHFLSHTLVSMLLAWLIINLIAAADTRLFRPEHWSARWSTEYHRRGIAASTPAAPTSDRPTTWPLPRPLRAREHERI